MLVVGLIAGLLAGIILKGRGFGLIGNTIVGILGGFVGGFLFNALDLGPFGLPPIVFSILTALVGALILLVIISFIKRR